MLTRKVRHLPDLIDQLSLGTLSSWYFDKATGIDGLAKQTSKSAADALVTGYPRGYQVTDSETHLDWGRPNRSDPDKELRILYEQVYTGVQASFGKGRSKTKSPYDIGGDFFTQRITVQASNLSDQHLFAPRVDENTQRYWRVEFRGPILCCRLAGKAVPPTVLGNLDTLGATAIARCNPTNQVAAAANFLYEIRNEGLPKLFGLTLLKDRVKHARAIGDEYLNKEFGWDPLIGDLKHVAYAIANAHTILSQYERDSGKVVRRRYEFPVEETLTSTVIGSQEAALGIYPRYADVQNPTQSPERFLYLGPSSNLIRERRTWKKVWFSGAFTYHLPSGYKSRYGMVESARKAQTLLGLDLTPEVVWNAAPWTWAVDWFSNAGDVIANLSHWATDGLVLKYGYVMEHQIVTDTYFVTNAGRLTTSLGASPSPIVIRVETKRRKRATPFGFGLTWSGLSPRQIAISVALGLTKGWKFL